MMQIVFYDFNNNETESNDYLAIVRTDIRPMVNDTITVYGQEGLYKVVKTVIDYDCIEPAIWCYVIKL